MEAQQDHANEADKMAGIDLFESGKDFKIMSADYPRYQIFTS